MAGITDEYRTLTTAAGWIDRSSRGRLLVEGADAVSFLQALVSNDVMRCDEGQGAFATYLTPQGRMIADLEIYRRPGGLVIDVAAGAAAPLATRLDLSVFSEDVRVTDVSERLVEFLVIGAGASKAIAVALSVDAAALDALPELSQVAWQDGFVARAAEALLPSFKIVAPASARETLLEGFARAQMAAMSESLVDALRIEAGRPLFGVDMFTDTIPLEAGLLDRAISTSKGCYVGQEIVIRILHRGGGRVAKRLARLAIDGDAAPAPGTVLRADGRDVGQVTSVAPSPTGAGVIALGFVARDAAEIGRHLDLAGADNTARIAGFAA